MSKDFPKGDQYMRPSGRGYVIQVFRQRKSQTCIEWAFGWASASERFHKVGRWCATFEECHAELVKYAVKHSLRKIRAREEQRTQ
jgi:hypothetical protein